MIVFYLFILQVHNNPPPLAGHTLTLRRHADSESLIVIGGFDSAYGFLEAVWEYDLKTEMWSALKTFGNKPVGG